MHVKQENSVTVDKQCPPLLAVYFLTVINPFVAAMGTVLRFGASGAF